MVKTYPLVYAPIVERHVNVTDDGHLSVMHIQNEPTAEMRRTWLTFSEGTVLLEVDHGAKAEKIVGITLSRDEATKLRDAITYWLGAKGVGP